jgi:hypothetical protein
VPVSLFIETYGGSTPARRRDAHPLPAMTPVPPGQAEELGDGDVDGAYAQ